MINKLKITLAVYVLFCMLSCASKQPEDIQPYWYKVALSYSQQGVVYYKRQQYELALVEFKHALNSYQRFDDVVGVGESLLNLSKTEISLHNLNTASIYVDDLEKHIDQYGLSDLQEYADIVKSSIMIETEKFQQAKEITEGYIGESGENVRSVNDDVHLSFLINRVRIAYSTSDAFPQWVDVFETKVKQLDKYVARLNRFKAQVAVTNNDLDNANTLFSSALGNYRKNANPDGVLSTLLEWGDALQNLGEDRIASHKFESAYKVSYSHGLIHEKKKSLLKLTALYKQLNDEKNLKRVTNLLATMN